MLTRETLSRIDRLAHAQTTQFTRLVEISGLQPALDLAAADLHGIDLRGDVLSGFNFSHADLSGADLRHAIGLTTANLSNIIVDDQTQWPANMDMAGNTIDHELPQTAADAFFSASYEAIMRWLKEGLEKYLFEGASRYAFSPFEPVIGMSDTLEEDLLRVFDDSRGSAMYRELWRKAIVELFYSYEWQTHDAQGQQRTVEILSMLLKLARLTDAYDIVVPLGQWIRSSNFSELALSGGRKLGDQAFLLAVDFMNRGNEARDCVQELLTNMNLDPRLAGAVFLQLCASDPERWPYHYLQLVDKLADMREAWPEDERQALQHAFVESFVDTVGRGCIIDASRFADVYNQMERSGTRGRWLIQAVLEMIPRDVPNYQITSTIT